MGAGQVVEPGVRGAHLPDDVRGVASCRRDRVGVLAHPVLEVVGRDLGVVLHRPGRIAQPVRLVAVDVAVADQDGAGRQLRDGVVVALRPRVALAAAGPPSGDRRRRPEWGGWC